MYDADAAALSDSQQGQSVPQSRMETASDRVLRRGVR